MTTKSDTARDTLQRDITESLLRLKLARARRASGEVKICEKRLNELLDRWVS